MATVTIELDDALAAELDALGQQTGVCVHDLVRDSLVAFVNGQSLSDWTPTPADADAVAEARADFAAGQIVSQSVVDAEMQALLDAP